MCARWGRGEVRTHIPRSHRQSPVIISRGLVRGWKEEYVRALGNKHGCNGCWGRVKLAGSDAPVRVYIFWSYFIADDSRLQSNTHSQIQTYTYTHPALSLLAQSMPAVWGAGPSRTGAAPWCSGLWSFFESRCRYWGPSVGFVCDALCEYACVCVRWNIASLSGLMSAASVYNSCSSDLRVKTSCSEVFGTCSFIL
jgi:hypothetical protein